LWRVSPHFAWGGALDLVGFRYQPPPSLGLHEAAAAAVFFGLLGRGYLLEEGSVEPYVELGLGGGTLARAFRETDETRYTETGAGPALRLGGGVDFYLGTRLRLGPALGWTHVFVDKINRCSASRDDQCNNLPTSDQGTMSGYVVLVARLTFLFGDEL
jgi:hypothetical protein